MVGRRHSQLVQDCDDEVDMGPIARHSLDCSRYWRILADFDCHCDAVERWRCVVRHVVRDRSVTFGGALLNSTVHRSRSGRIATVL